MNIDLPERFNLRVNQENGYAEVRDGVLHIYRDFSVRKLMYSITYYIKGKEKCFYCGKNVKNRNMTLDHMYAKDCGGPTIPNNLVPCCEKCNSEKSNMNAQNYLVFREMNMEDAQIYRSLVMSSQEVSKKSGMFDLPIDWITVLSTEEMTLRADPNVCKSKQYKKQIKYFKKYNSFSKPIVVDKNGFVLEGKEILFLAMKKDVKEVKAIVLENVEVHI